MVLYIELIYKGFALMLCTILLMALANRRLSTEPENRSPE